MGKHSFKPNGRKICSIPIPAFIKILFEIWGHKNCGAMAPI
jgi:hypothetical protein